MRRFGFLGIFTILACVAPSARADVSYAYVADANGVTLANGQTATFNLYLEEHTDTTKGQQSIFDLTGGGLFSSTVQATRTAGDGGVTFANGGKDINGNNTAAPWASNTTVSIASGATNPAKGNIAGSISNGGPPNPYVLNSAKTTANDQYRDVLLGTMTVTGGNVTTILNLGPKTITNSATLTWAGPGPAFDPTKRVGLDTDNGTGSPNTTFVFQGARDFTFTITAAQPSTGVPEPSSMALCGLAACSMGIGAWRRRKAKQAAQAAADEAAAAEAAASVDV